MLYPIIFHTSGVEKIIVIVDNKNPINGNGNKYLLLFSSLNGGFLNNEDDRADIEPSTAHKSNIIKLSLIHFFIVSEIFSELLFPSYNTGSNSVKFIIIA